MSETATKATPETHEPEFKGFLEPHGQFGKEQRERAEAKNIEPEAEVEIEFGLDGEPLASGDKLEFYNQIIDTKVNDPDAGIRDRAADWNLNFKQRHDMTNSDLSALEKEAEVEIGRIEAKEQADNFKAASAEHEKKYQAEMAEVRTDRELYGMFYEAALKQLPEIEMTATDALGQHYEKQQLTAAREKEAARIADVVLTQFKNARAPTETEPGDDGKKKEVEPPEASSTSSSSTSGEVVTTPPAVEATPSDEEDEPKTLPPIPAPPSPVVLTPAPISELARHPAEPTDEELRSDVEFDDSDEAIRGVIEALEELLEDDFAAEEYYPEKYKKILQKARAELAYKSRWQRIRETLHVPDRWSAANIFTSSAAASGESGPAPEKRKKGTWRKYALGAAAAAAMGLGIDMASGGGAQEDGSSEVTHSVHAPGNQLPLVDVDSGAGAPTAEFSESAKTAESGEGWYNTIHEATGIKDQEQLQVVLKEVGPKLLSMGEAYLMGEQLGSYGISKSGEISDEALSLIHDTAQRHGFIK